MKENRGALRPRMAAERILWRLADGPTRLMHVLKLADLRYGWILGVFQRKEQARQEKLRSAFAACARALMVLIFFLIAVALVCVTWHYLAPPSMHWMADDAVKTVSTSLFSGVLFMSFFLYLRDRV